jgi:transposase
MLPSEMLAREEALQSEHKSRHDSFHVIEGEVSRLDASPDVPRRRWWSSAKARILGEALVPGVNVSAVARRHGLKPQQVFAWRRQALRSGRIEAALPISELPAFLPVSIERSGGVELVVADVTIRAGADVSVARLAEVIRAARSA